MITGIFIIMLLRNNADREAFDSLLLDILDLIIVQIGYNDQL